MRMWMVNPQGMCRQHLLGEHSEIHMFVGSLKKEKNIDGYIRDGFLEIHKLYDRHLELVHELKRRQYNHNSPLDFLPTIYGNPYFRFEGYVDIRKSLKDLHDRCPRCKTRYHASSKKHNSKQQKLSPRIAQSV